MSASTHQPLRHGRDARPARARGGGSQFRLSQNGLLAGFVLAGLVAGCSSYGTITTSKGSPSLTTASPSPRPTVVDEQQAILESYRKFWATLTPASGLPAARRRAALSPVATDPELKSLLTGMAASDANARVFYGADVPRASAASISPDRSRAVIDDCLDSSGSGDANRQTGKRLTVGVARNHVVVTMAATAGTWRVYFVSYPKTPC